MINILPCPRGIQSVTQSHANFIHIGDNWRCAQLPASSCTSIYVRLWSLSSISSVIGVWWWNTTLWAENTEQYKGLNTMEGSYNRSSSCSQLVSAWIQRERLLLPFCFGSNFSFSILPLAALSRCHCSASVFSINVTYLNFATWLARTDTAMYYVFPDSCGVWVQD